MSNILKAVAAMIIVFFALELVIGLVHLTIAFLPEIITAAVTSAVMYFVLLNRR